MSCTYSESSDELKDTPKEVKPINKGQAECTHVYTLYRSYLRKWTVSLIVYTMDKNNGCMVPKMSLLRGSTVTLYIDSRQLKKELVVRGGHVIRIAYGNNKLYVHIVF